MPSRSEYQGRSSGPDYRLPLSVIPLSCDAQLAIRAIGDPARHGQPLLDVRLERRSPSDKSATAFCATAAGFRVPLHLADSLCDEILSVAKRAAEAAVFAPLSKDDPA